MLEVMIQKGDLNETYYGTFKKAPSLFASMPAFLNDKSFVILINTTGQEIIINTRNIVTISEST